MRGGQWLATTESLRKVKSSTFIPRRGSSSRRFFFLHFDDAKKVK